MNRDSRLVYSTDGGRVRETTTPTRGQPAPRRDPDDGFVRLRREKAGRGGKTATTITGLPGADAHLEAALKELKQFLGTGGSRNGRVLELQGDHRDRLKAKLESMGYTVKIAGG